MDRAEIVKIAGQIGLIGPLHSGIFSRGAQFLNDSMVHADSSGLVHRRNLTKVLK